MFLHNICTMNLKHYLLIASLFLSLNGMQIGCLEKGLDDSKPDSRNIETDNSWKSIGDNFQRRVLEVKLDDSRAKLIIYKFDPNNVTFALHHNNPPERMTDLANRLEANLLINGGYFDEEFTPTGMFIIDGERIGRASYDLHRSGALIIQAGLASLVDTSNDDLPTVSEEVSILQSFPLLVIDNQPAIKEDSGKLARRTVIAENNDGEFLVILVDTTPVSLFELMNILLESDLAIKIALNLDGGPSSGVVVDVQGFSEKILPLSPLPQVVSIQIKN